MTRIMGLDYGSKTVGVAISDELGITAQGVETITRSEEGKLRRTLARIAELSQEYRINRIILGYPKNMDNSCSILGRKAYDGICREGADGKRSPQREAEGSD